MYEHRLLQLSKSETVAARAGAQVYVRELRGGARQEAQSARDIQLQIRDDETECVPLRALDVHVLALVCANEFD